MITFGKKLERHRPAALPPQPAAAPVQVRPLPAPAPETPRQEDGAWRVLPLEGFFRFSYLDASGRPSLRRLAASELKVGPGKLLLGGVDADLDAYRGFRVDRIHSLQADSGETVSRNILDWLLDRAARQAREKAAREKGQRPPARERGKREGGEAPRAAA